MKEIERGDVYENVEDSRRTSSPTDAPTTHFVPSETYFREKKLSTLAKNAPANRRSRNSQAELNTYDVGSLLTICRNAGCLMRKSLIQHKDVGTGLFTGRPIESTRAKGYYYRLIIYVDLCRQRQLKKAYGWGTMTMTVAQFSKWEFKIPGTIVHGEKLSKKWIVP